ncbi:peptidase [Cellulomonas alba]|uniref:Peptidase n=1 Tax=Cellulomonas alba TaxID=3053467 RepID=A0ABT7SD79_9CELL|nr:peptidase [Cellulomonas alba]MDM7853517.1 peptidase [Cellulomonas alba]
MALGLVVGGGWSALQPDKTEPRVVVEAEPPATTGESTGADPADPAIPAGVLRALGYPTPGYEEGATPLGHPPALSETSSSYKFLHTQPDGITPVAWDPCRPIHYVTTGDAPAGGDELIDEAVAAVSAATGLVFVDDGRTDEALDVRRVRPFSEPDRYGDRFVPVLIAWTSEKQDFRLQGAVAGLTMPIAVTADGRLMVDVVGTVELDAVQVMNAQRLDGQGVTVVMHELAHLVGLDHVADPSQVMNPSGTRGVNAFGAGDLAGLALLGEGACEPRL